MWHSSLPASADGCSQQPGENMYKPSLYALTLIAGLTTCGLIASAQNYSREVKVPGITRLISHDAVPEGFDPVSASDSQLDEFGFPPRPDQSDAEAYSKWVEAVSLTRVPGQYINTGRYHGPNKSNGKIEATSRDNVPAYSSGNWSGFAIAGGSPILTQVRGEWIVPSVNNQFESFTGYMSEWVGLDGDGTDDLIQDGTEQDWIGGTAGYYAWIEFFPQPELEISSFPVSPGDVIQAYSWETESGGVVTGHYFLSNLNTKISGSTSLPIPKGTKFYGKSAEWIVERTEVNGSFTSPIPFFAGSFMGGAYAFRNSSTAIPYWNQANQNITMEQSGTKLSQVGSLSSNSMWFTWDHYN